MTGTSMACPAVSGLLVRQYFTFYPTGAAVPANSFTIGTLIRAVLLNSTVDMTGISGYPSNQVGGVSCSTMPSTSPAMSRSSIRVTFPQPARPPAARRRIPSASTAMNR